uniref:Uncharacterized protein n=1 Tax=Rhizophora mucronata TaxID=61149 RepID=A0A2P2IR33_RHIMU
MPRNMLLVTVDMTPKRNLRFIIINLFGIKPPNLRRQVCLRRLVRDGVGDRSPDQSQRAGAVAHL